MCQRIVKTYAMNLNPPWSAVWAGVDSLAFCGCHTRHIWKPLIIDFILCELMKDFLHRLLAAARHPIHHTKHVSLQSFRSAQVRWTAFNSKSWEVKGKIVGLISLKVRNTTSRSDVPYMCHLACQLCVRSTHFFRACRICSCGKTIRQFMNLLRLTIPKIGGPSMEPTLGD